ncbi:hypothetical protein FRC18_009902 [Serendipita sp. 400]|nr:hypothetical protein FRC18_009902 [Serendipita sp. 400]
MDITAPYGQFQTPNNILTEDGGSWNVQLSSNDFKCISGSRVGYCASNGCLPCGGCRACGGSPALSSYSIKYIANVSIPLVQYGGIKSFDYNFSYQFMWATYDIPTYEGDAGLPLSTLLTVGTSSNTDNFVSVDPKAWVDGKADLGELFFHSGTTSFLKSADGDTAYIPITLDFSFTTERYSSVWYFVLRAFKITTPTQSGTPSSSGFGSAIRVLSPTSSSSNSSSFTTSMNSTSGLTSRLSTIGLPGFSPEMTPYPSGNDAPVSSSSSAPASGSAFTRRSSAGMIAGVVVVVMFLLGTVVLILLLFHKRKQGGLWQIVQGHSIQKATLSGNPQKSSNIVSTTVFATSSSLVVSRSPSHQANSQKEENLVRESGRDNLQTLPPRIEVDAPPPAYSTITIEPP